MVQYGAEYLVGFITFMPWTIHPKLNLQRHLMKPMFYWLTFPIYTLNKLESELWQFKGVIGRRSTPSWTATASCACHCLSTFHDNSVMNTHWAPGPKSNVDIYKIESFPCRMAFHCWLKSHRFVLGSSLGCLNYKLHTCWTAMVQYGAECLVCFITFMPWTIHLKLNLQRNLIKSMSYWHTFHIYTLNKLKSELCQFKGVLVWCRVPPWTAMASPVCHCVIIQYWFLI